MPFDGSELRRERNALDVPLDTLAAIAGISGCWLSKIERGVVEADGSTVLRLNAAMTALQNLAMHVEPLKLDFSQVSALRKLIDRMEQTAEPSNRSARNTFPPEVCHHEPTAVTQD